MADIEDCKRIFGSYCDFLKELELEPWFNKNLPKQFWENNCADLEILIDTREQQPLNFNNSIESKLDFGDYTAGGNKYSKTFVDRKAVGDFCSTMSGGIDRFRREMDRCVEFESYMFVVVESSVDKINEDNKKFVKNISYVWHNVKQLMLEYPKNIQFIFAHSRKGAQKIIPKLLYYGMDLWNVDVGYFLEKKIKEG
jgi:ERCC4-type nuclease